MKAKETSSIKIKSDKIEMKKIRIQASSVKNYFTSTAH